MSSASGKGKKLSTKEDKLMKSTLFLFQDNKIKLDIINKLKKVRFNVMRNRISTTCGKY